MFPWWSAARQVPQKVESSSGFTTCAISSVFRGLGSTGASPSAMACRSDLFCGSKPMTSKYSAVSVVREVSRSPRQAPARGRGGGSTSTGPNQTCTPWMLALSMDIGCTCTTRSRAGVKAAVTSPVRRQSAIAASMSGRCRLRRSTDSSGARLRACDPMAMTVGSSPRVSSSIQSRDMRGC
ncbi:Uncharacterised protein [Mycobacteroides abscessus subsp. abscessus]|nr:Uncharacterised protein [Mycobacteroides abscessus subsp. abscessus]